MLSKHFSLANGLFKRKVQRVALSTVTKAKIQEKFVLPKRYSKIDKSVWPEYIQLAIKYKPVNLGEGFPNFAPPKYLTEALAEVARSDDITLHQYTRASGHPRLVSALSKLYSKILSRELNPLTEIIVTVGGCEALFCTLAGHVEERDEVIIVEPFFEVYEPMVRSGGGVPLFIPLKRTSSNDTITSADFELDFNELESMFNKNTKALLINNPNNPLGKVYTECELLKIAELCIKWNVMCISDEVYEWLVFEPFKHIRMCTLPGMWERTITICTAGKTFCATGWKLGWAIGPSKLMENLHTVHDMCVQCSATPTQEALARTIEKELSEPDNQSSHLHVLALESKSKRDFMYNFLREVGMKPIVPQGGYFVVADWSPLASRVDLNSEKDKYKDYRFTKWMIKNVGLQGIPISAFYCDTHHELGENYVRYCFIKDQEYLVKAAETFRKWISNTN